MSAALRIAAGLDAASPVRAAREALAGAQGVWIVGGAVRDAALGRAVTDVDLAVTEGEGDAARRIARALACHAFPLSEELGAWRIASGERAWCLDVVRVRGGGIEADLGLRDFTVNAIAVPLARLGGTAAVEDAAAGDAAAGDAAAGEPGLLDPHDGLTDIDAGVLRAVSARSFEDDPLRLVRAARLAAALGFEVEPGTRELARRAAGRAADPAGERQLVELRGILTGADPLRGVRVLDELDVIPVLLPELQALRGIGQTPYHHLDAFEHSLEVLRRLVELRADPAAVLGVRLAAEVEPILERELADEMTRGGALHFAALLHDIGKSRTRSVSETGRVTFMDHDRVGAAMVRELCARLRTSRSLAEFLAAMALNHLRLGFLVHAAPLSRRTVLEYLRATEPYSIEVSVLTIADRLATQGGKTKPEAIEAHLALARAMLAEALAWRRDGPPRAPIRGDELAAELGIEPGPQLGRLLSELEAAVFAGEVGSRAEAIEVARGSLEATED